MPRTRLTRPGFTLIELLVVIAIIAVLVGLLLPAVQKVRESANRMKCSNNLKQLAIALHARHDAMGGFPAARQQLPNPADPADPIIHSWTPHVLPYVEQENLYKLYRFDRQWDNGATNSSASGPIRQVLTVFLCPSTAAAPTARGIASNRGPSDYAATSERNWPNPFVSAAQAPFVRTADPNYIGVLGHTTLTTKAERKITDITDGSSNTFLLAECAGRNLLYYQGKKQPTNTSNGPWAHPNGRLQLGGFNPAIPGDVVGPCAVNCVNDKEIYSFHSGGANVAMADGSCRFLKQGIHIDVVLQLLTRARGEVITVDY